MESTRRDTDLSPQVLVVDDDPDIREAVALGLSLKGYRVATAQHGAEALESISQEAPAVVVLDMEMPVLDGWQFAQELDRRGWRVPIVVLTAEADAEACGREVGATAAICKPYDFRSLLATIDAIMKKLRDKTIAFRQRKPTDRGQRGLPDTGAGWALAS